MSASDLSQSIGEVIYRLRSLGAACTVLQVGAHPDDEDAGKTAGENGDMP